MANPQQTISKTSYCPFTTSAGHPQSLNAPSWCHFRRFSNKRDVMHYRHHSPGNSTTNILFPDPKMHMSPENVLVSTYSTPETMEDALKLSRTSPPLPPQSAKEASPQRQPLPRLPSSSWWTEMRKLPTSKQETRSRKTSYATIRTDATDSQPAFESDAFAVQMPTTREPVIDPSIYRVQLPTPSKAQVEAYHTYKQKAQLMRETEYKKNYIPEKLVSYDYAHGDASSHPRPLDQPSTSRLPSSPRTLSPGAFPTSPPIPQHEWPARRYQIQGPRSISDSSSISIARKPVGLGDIKSRDRPIYQRGDADTGASSPTSNMIKVRIKPKLQEADKPQKESRWALYNRKSPQSSNNSSRSTSPTKPLFTNTTSATVAGDAVFGYPSTDITGTPATGSRLAASTPPKPAKGATRSRWAWLRPAELRVEKPTAAKTAHGAPPMTKRLSTYVDPFLLHATPASTRPNFPSTSRPPSPKKLVRIHAIQSTAPELGSKGKFETGFAQLLTLGTLVLKLCLLVYALVGLYFVLDAVREAVHTLGAPFRGVGFVLSWVWVGSVYVGKWAGKGWERWGVRVALKGGWTGWTGRWW